ncbi:MAG: TVP38/TMEM64 family protein [Bacilli bacterium]|jgi:uncharacterized membrane protein YdjX (TVP38/TMEM64 family)|nr:TVP38/TMEM64 family protein [Bacilli bacterium]
MEIIEFFQNINEWLDTFLEGLGPWAPIISSLLIIVEGVLAFLPLFVFVTINVHTLGFIIGGTISWCCTVLGSFITFYLCRNGLSKWFYKKKKEHKLMKTIDKLKFSQIVLIISIPFAPSFFINVGAGLSHIPVKKFLYSLLLGKVCVVIFCGFIGTSLLESLTNPYALIKVILLVLAGYLVSRYVGDKYGIDDKY